MLVAFAIFAMIREVRAKMKTYVLEPLLFLFFYVVFMFTWDIIFFVTIYKLSEADEKSD